MFKAASSSRLSTDRVIFVADRALRQGLSVDKDPIFTTMILLLQNYQVQRIDRARFPSFMASAREPTAMILVDSQPL